MFGYEKGLVRVGTEKPLLPHVVRESVSAGEHW